MIVRADWGGFRRLVLGSTIKIIGNLLVNEIDNKMSWILMIVNIWMHDKMFSILENVWFISWIICVSEEWLLVVGFILFC